MVRWQMRMLVLRIDCAGNFYFNDEKSIIHFLQGFFMEVNPFRCPGDTSNPKCISCRRMYGLIKASGEQLAA